MIAARRYKVGDLRPSQMLYSFGIGAIIDLPRLSGLIMGLDDWGDPHQMKEIAEPRLLAALNRQPGCHAVGSLRLPPAPDQNAHPAQREEHGSQEQIVQWTDHQIFPLATTTAPTMATVRSRLVTSKGRMLKR